ncbi:MAG: PfkB family carbohydrate kinase [Hyphomicrobiales bacterium]|nr:PfkB family carbohydrate kinase [Hyphomicrobiales bacterium]
MTRVLVIGEAIADFLPCDAEGRQFSCVLGGSGFNTTLALARLGLQPRYVAALATDALGRRFRAVLAAEGADLSGLKSSERPMPVAIVSPGAASHGAMFALHLAGTAHEGPADWPVRLPTDIAHVHAASFAATTGVAAGASLVLLADAKARATSSYDPNIRSACLPPHREALALIEARVAAATIAKASQEDLGWLYPGLAPDQALQRWMALGTKIAIATRGEQGSLALTAHGFVEAPGDRITVVDTVGAGDTFTAALLSAMADDGALGDAGHMASAEQLSRWLGLANRAAALTCTRPGCDPPRRAELG